MNKHPEVSVVIPCYNCQKYIKKTVNSLLGQDFSNFEIILVNDGSNKKCSKKLKSIQKENRRRVKYIYQVNKGLGGARNTGVKNAQGRYILNLDADDWAKQGFIKKPLNKLKKGEWQAVAINAQLSINERKTNQTFFNKHNTPSKISLKSQITKNSIPSTALITKTSIEETGYYKRVSHMEDYDFWLRFLMKGNNISLEKEPLFYYRIHPDSLSGQNLKMAKAEYQIFKTLHSKVSHKQTHNLKKLVRKRLSDTLARLGMIYSLNNRPNLAKKCLNQAWEKNSSFKTWMLLKLFCYCRPVFNIIASRRVS